jgi:glucosamine kinase
MNMILIADSGSTKTDWTCVSPDRSKFIGFKSQGYNPNYISIEEISADIRRNLPSGFVTEEVSEINFYGAGVTELQYPFMKTAMQTVFKQASVINIAMDTLASARALLGHDAGFAAILGTGTNTCLYDGEKLTLNIDSLGFILGDEGSGAYLGKRMICDFIRGDMPKEVREMVAPVLGKNGDEIIDQIYTKPFPNRYCAQFAPFIHDNMQKYRYFDDMVTDAFDAFFKNIVSHYPDYKQYKFNCVGSIGYYFLDTLKPVAAKYGMETGVILRAPMEGLIKYHTGQI